MRDLNGFVRRHQVSWEIAPHFELLEGALRHVGFDLTLHAQVEAGIDPGSSEALAIRARLHEIALAALPAGARYDVQPFRATLHFRSETDWDAEIDLVLVLRSRRGPFGVVDERDRRSTRAIGRTLTRMGVPERVYLKQAAA